MAQIDITGGGPGGSWVDGASVVDEDTMNDIRANALDAESRLAAIETLLTSIKHSLWLPAAMHDGGPYMAVWSANADATAPVDTGLFETDVTSAELEFVNATMNQLWASIALPSDWVPPLDIRISWHTPTTSGNVVWQVQTLGVGVGGNLSASMNAAQTVVSAAQGTTNRVSIAALSNLTTTGLVAGGLLFIKLLRDPAHASDTLADSAFFLGAELTYRRSGL